jgi:polysaccharide export outer membrane protein
MNNTTALIRRLITLLLVLAAAFASWAGAQVEPSEYQLGPGDTIRIQVYQNPDLTLETRVTENGIITYPLIGAVKIGGLSILTAEQRIARALQSGGFIRQPQVSILLLQNRANQISVLGHVNRPGRFPLETSVTRVSEMVAIAGGIATTGADVIILNGTRNGLPFRKEIDIASVFMNNNPNDNIVVAGGDEIYVPRAPTFYIYGEVQRPGSYRIERGMTIRQALATGGGPTLRGTERNLRVHRRGADGAPELVSVDPNELVRPDDVLYVRESMF